MRAFALVVGLTVGLAGSVAEAITLGFDFNSLAGSILIDPNHSPPGPGGGINSFQEFSLSAPVTIYALGWWDENPSGIRWGYTPTVSIDEVLGDPTSSVASATISGGDIVSLASSTGAGQWLLKPISPVTLGVGTHYIGAFTPWYLVERGWPDVESPDFNNAPEVTVGNVHETSGYVPMGPEGLEFVAFGPTFATSPVPEPNAALLLALGLAGLAGTRRNRTRHHTQGA